MNQDIEIVFPPSDEKCIMPACDNRRKHSMATMCEYHWDDFNLTETWEAKRPYYVAYLAWSGPGSAFEEPIEAYLAAQDYKKSL